MTLIPADNRSRVARLPAIAKPTHDNLLRVVEQLREIVEVREGRRPNQNVLDRVLTVRDLVDAGVIAVKSTAQSTYNGAPVSATQPDEDLTSPPAPTGLSALGAMQNIILDWNDPGFASPVYAYTEIWRAATDNLGAAVSIGTSVASVYADPVGATNSTYYYWIRFVSQANVAGPFNAVAGVSASTSFILTAHLADFLVTAQKLANSSVDATKIANAAVGSAAIANLAVQTAHIVDLAVTTAKIANLAVDSAKIVDASIVTAKIADATITTAKIGAAQITSALIASAAIQTAHIVDANVTTLKLAGQAVTIPVSAFSVDHLNLTNFDQFYVGQSCAITSSGAPINIFASLNYMNSTGNAVFVQIGVFRNGAQIYNTGRFNCVVVDGGHGSFAVSLTDTPGAGTYTYTLEVKRAYTDLGSIDVESRSLVLLETKR